MNERSKNIKQYYSESGSYLKEHADYLDSANIEKDIRFLIKALNINKQHNILDIACGHGRHSYALAKKGYMIDGVDFSPYLLEHAQKNVINGQKYFRMDVEKMRLKRKYDRAYWFFSDLANINIIRAIASISKNIKIGGRVLFDTDNVFRIVSKLNNTPNKKLFFNSEKLILVEKTSGLEIMYPVMPMWKIWLENTGLDVEYIIGDYDFSKYTINSPRLIFVVKKLA